MRISDWRSDVCSSDLLFSSQVAGSMIVLLTGFKQDAACPACRRQNRKSTGDTVAMKFFSKGNGVLPVAALALAMALPGTASAANADDTITLGAVVSLTEIGRASCRERVCQKV